MEAEAAQDFAGGKAVAGGWVCAEELAQERRDLGGPRRREDSRRRVRKSESGSEPLPQRPRMRSVRRPGRSGGLRDERGAQAGGALPIGFHSGVSGFARNATRFSGSADTSPVGSSSSSSSKTLQARTTAGSGRDPRRARAIRSSWLADTGNMMKPPQTPRDEAALLVAL